MSKKNEIKIAKVKGRPMLTWVGKRPLTSVRAYPAQHVESFSVPSPIGGKSHPHPNPPPPAGEGEGGGMWSDWPEQFPRGGLLFHGDNKDVLAHLLANGFRGKVKLIYIDPPFDSGADYVRKVQLRGVKGTTKVDGEEYTLGEQIQYTDIWANDNYLQFMYERLVMLRELLHERGSLFLHCDYRRSAQLRLVADEVMGGDSFVNEIIWVRTSSHNIKSKGYVRVNDHILFYSKTADFVFNDQFTDYSEAQLSRYKEDETGRLYKAENLTFSSTNPGRQFEWRGTKPPPHRSWGASRDQLEEWFAEGRILTKSDGTPRLDGLKVYLDDMAGSPLTTNWDDIGRVGNTATERTDYPTQKPEQLLERIVTGSTNMGDIVLDGFIGAGTTACVAQRLGRRWIGCDINKGAIQTAAKRLQTIRHEQAAALSEQRQGKLVEDEDAPPTPAQLAFNIYRVNDYDLQVQHNEAVQLACEHIGVTRTRADGYFDGTLGNRLVKIVPFNHPLTPLDLEDLKKELHNRPGEERDIVLVCLGMELTAKAAMEDYNRARPINKLHVIELRTDRKYGGFIKHEPLTVSVSIKRKGDKLQVEVNDVLSPTILQRLNMEQGVFRAQIDDWRAVVDCIMIDTDFDGAVFNVALSDIPARKQDLVEGRYELPAPNKGATVAVKVIDMLGEETVVTKQV